MNIAKIINCIIKLGIIQRFNVSNKVNNIIQLRRFHNLIKMQLITNACKQTDAKNLLDIACGRGGDLQKWINNKLHLKYVLAFDSHKESIFNSISKGNEYDGAIARFQNLKRNYRGKLPFINFQQLDILNPEVLTKINLIDSNKLYDVVACQFALHYFCQTDEILNNVLSIISKKLKVGGLFIGTATDGDLVQNILANGDVNISLLTLLKQPQNQYLFYISEISPDIKGTQNYFEIQGASSEFYLFKQKLTDLALKNNLELIQYKSFYDYYNELKASTVTLSAYEMIISFLNFSFIFKKI